MKLFFCLDTLIWFELKARLDGFNRRARVSRIVIQMAQSEGSIYISKSKQPILQRSTQALN